jgi:hypothetical protein
VDKAAALKKAQDAADKATAAALKKAQEDGLPLVDYFKYMSKQKENVVSTRGDRERGCDRACDREIK